MFRRSELAVAGGSPADAGASRRRPGRPNLAGDLDGLLDPRPLFRTTLRGYDRLEVDNYVAWAEAELVAARRENDDLLTRYGTCSAELEISRRLLACSPEGRELTRASERVGAILRMAADEAAALTETGAADADRIRAEARSEADALLRRAAEIKELTLAECRLMEAEARSARDETLARHADLDRLAAEAQAERERLAAEAQAERERLAAEAEAERERLGAEARAALRRLTGQLDDALGTLSGLLDEEERTGPGVRLAS